MPRSAEFHCEVCGTTTNTPTHWVVIECGDLCLTVFRWNLQAATAGGPRRLCEEAHAQVYISRRFDSICSPSKPDFLRLSQ